MAPGQIRRSVVRTTAVIAIISAIALTFIAFRTRSGTEVRIADLHNELTFPAVLDSFPHSDGISWHANDFSQSSEITGQTDVERFVEWASQTLPQSPEGRGCRIGGGVAEEQQRQLYGLTPGLKYEAAEFTWNRRIVRIHVQHNMFNISIWKSGR